MMRYKRASKFFIEQNTVNWSNLRRVFAKFKSPCYSAIGAIAWEWKSGSLIVVFTKNVD